MAHLAPLFRLSCVLTMVHVLDVPPVNKLPSAVAAACVCCNISHQLHMVGHGMEWVRLLCAIAADAMDTLLNAVHTL